MSETVSADVSTETEAEEEAVDTTTYDPFVQSAIDMVKTDTATANNLADKVIHAGNTTKLLHEVRDEKETTDPNILKYREKVEEANNFILNAQKMVEQYILDHNLVDTKPIDIEAVTEEYKAIKTRLKAMVTVIATLPGGESAVKTLPALTPIPGTRTGSSGSGGSNIRRPRIASIKCNGEDIFTEKDGKRTSNMTTLSMHLTKILGHKIETSDLQTHLFGAAGTEDLSTLNGKPVSFSVALNDSEGAEKTFSIEVIPSVKEG